MSALVVSAALLIAGCGGSSHPATTATTSAATKASFIAQLNSVCNRANSAFNTATAPKAKVAVIDHYLVVFKSVPVPSSLKSDYEKYVSVLAQELAKLKSGDSTGLATLARTQARPLAVKLGATDCAHPK